MAQPPDPATIARIEEAAQRLLSGRPLKARPGVLTVEELATEADLDRAQLYRRYNEQRLRFRDEVEAAQADPAPATLREQELLQQVERLEADNLQLRERVRDLTERKETLKQASQGLVRIINLLECEKQLAQESSGSSDKKIARLEKEKEELEQRLYRLAETRRPELTLLSGEQEDPVNLLGDAARTRDEDD